MTLEQMLKKLASAPSKEDAKKRQMAVWKNEPVDRLPIIFGVPTPELKDAPHYNLEECYNDKEKMLFEALYGMISIAESPGDGIPSIRANTGTGTLATTFGLDQRVFPDTLPWIESHLSKEELSAMEPSQFEDVTNLGIMPMVLEYQRYFTEKLDGPDSVFLSDTQGPFDTAHLVRGHDLFTDMYDDPPFAHHVLELSTAVYIAATKTMKENLNEPYDEGPHGNGVYVANGAVRICEDSPVLLSPHLIDEFVVPYTDRALSAFGGGFIHYCGRNDHLFKTLAQVDAVHGFNFGMPEQEDMQMVMDELLDRGKVYYAAWTRQQGETLDDYFSRIMQTLHGRRESLILCPCLLPEEQANADCVMEAWVKAQG